MSKDIETKITKIKAEVFDLMMAQDVKRQEINTLENAKLQKFKDISDLQNQLKFANDSQPTPDKDKIDG